MNLKMISIVAVATGLWAFTMTGPVKADDTLKKMGKAIQYTTRKDTENLSQDTHRALGHNSVHQNRTGINAHTRYVLTPAGNKYRIYHHHRRHHIM